MYDDSVPWWGEPHVRFHGASPPFVGLRVDGARSPFILGGIFMILKQCNRCSKPCAYPAKYCPDCLPIVTAMREARRGEVKGRADRAYNTRRDPKYQKFYRSKPWRMLSARYMQDHMWKCERCGGLAVEVHHIKAIQTDEGWDRRLDVTNLMAVCVDCHNKEHKRFMRRSERH